MVRPTPEEIWTDSEAKILDVRGTDEWEAGHLESAENIPLKDLPSRAESFRGQRVVTHCGSGGRALIAASILEGAGADATAVNGSYAELKRAERSVLSEV
jgi:rhodanese-related sulfurtransferase